MTRRCWHRLRVLLLAVLLGLGISLSAVQGGVVAAQMTVAADAIHDGPGGCDGCCDDHAGMDASACLAMCGSAAQGLMPPELLPLPLSARTDFLIVRLQLHGRCPTPAHGPPKILALG